MRSHSPNYIGELPAEIIEEIYIHSLNLLLPYTSRRFYKALSSRSVRLHVCKQAFSSARKFELGKCPSSARSIVWTEIFLQKWFTPKLSADLEAALKAPGRDDASLTTGGAYLPKHVLNGPFTNSKVRFLCRLLRWNTQLHPRHWAIAAEGLHQAIREGNRRVVRILVSPPLRVFPHIAHCETWATTSHDDEIGRFLIGKKQSLGEAGWEDSGVQRWYQERLTNDPQNRRNWEWLADALGRTGTRVVDSPLHIPEDHDFGDDGDDWDYEPTVHEAAAAPMHRDDIGMLTNDFAKACLRHDGWGPLKFEI